MNIAPVLLGVAWIFIGIFFSWKIIKEGGVLDFGGLLLLFIGATIGPILPLILLLWWLVTDFSINLRK